MLLKDFIAQSVAALGDVYPEAEARRVVAILCESLLGVRSYTHLVEPETVIPPSCEASLAAAMERLRAAEPVQYLTGHAPFCGFDFRVTRDVLIPRPETECLVREACAAASSLRGRPGAPLRILDLCTGSGCIAWALALSLPGAQVTGVDVSEAALAVARGQDFSGETGVRGALAPSFVLCDILDGQIPFAAGSFDLVVANPPYLPEARKAQMRRNVLDYEPGLALFVPDDDPLLFYRAVARWSRHCLAPGGRGFAEIDEAFGPESRAVFLQNGFENAAIIRDFFGKDRIVAY